MLITQSTLQKTLNIGLYAATIGLALAMSMAPAQAEDPGKGGLLDILLPSAEETDPDTANPGEAVDEKLDSDLSLENAESQLDLPHTEKLVPASPTAPQNTSADQPFSPADEEMSHADMDQSAADKSVAGKSVADTSNPDASDGSPVRRIAEPFTRQLTHDIALLKDFLLTQESLLTYDAEVNGQRLGVSRDVCLGNSYLNSVCVELEGTFE